MPANPQLRGTLLLIVKHPVPSLNTLFAMTQWQRHREKKATLDALLLGLRRSGEDSLILTTSLEERNILQTAYATLEYYQETQKRKSALKSVSKRSKAKPKNAQKSK